ncbi:hypothetical protein PPL_00117 [Heterostelium album PN500]|uniref:Uncharacterized protein n=1 Tax=Heterostelium pallidum (strain ATCC 26659 / Pp 5 / PN500) TaxID=670386 RepID=D3AVK4_HETP5|nr:hypothetical protein PPL_00117 [Heterostelium album PN500]EFA86327.1 hypothetical protein PPL_00117 [Heterostelium album PN500]|eukprot:XP_020438432.1 hypothetical protein PPL_00117 [Heterostelium album PN500]
MQRSIIFICVLIAIANATEVSWVNNANQYNFFTPNNWNVNRTPVRDDNVNISPNNAYVYVNAPSAINSLTFDSPVNGTLVITGSGKITTNNAVLNNSATLYIDSSLKSAPAFQSNSSTTLLSKLQIKTGSIDTGYFNMMSAKVDLINGNQKINSNYINVVNSNIRQVSSNSEIKFATRFLGSNLESISSILNSNNKGLVSTVHSSNLSFTSSAFQTDNYMMFENSKINLVASSMRFRSLSLIDSGIFTAEASSVSFDKLFHTQSDNTITFKKFSTLQSSTGADFVATYRSSIYLENTILMMNGRFVLKDRSVLSFGGLVLPLTPIRIVLSDYAKVQYKGFFNNLFHSNNILADQAASESSEAVQNRELSTLTFELNDNAQFESDQNLNNINIIGGEKSSITLSNLVLSNSSIVSSNGLVINSNVVLNESTISSDVTNTGSISGSGVISGNLENQGTLGSFDTVSKIVIEGSVNSADPNSKIAILVNSNTDYTQIQVSQSLTLAQGVVVVKVSSAALLENNEFQLISYGSGEQAVTDNIVVEFENNQQVNYTLVTDGSSVSLKVNKAHEEPVTKSVLFISLMSVGAGVAAITALIVGALIIRNKRIKAKQADKGVKLDDNNSSIDISQ